MEAVRITFREVAKMSETPINPFDDAEEIAKRSMVIFFVIDCSGSMSGSKIGTVNSVMEELIPEIKDIGGADADIKLAVLKFSGGCEWMYDAPVSIGEFEWKPLEAEAFKERVHEVAEPVFRAGDDTHVRRLPHRQLRQGA